MRAGARARVRRGCKGGYGMMLKEKDFIKNTAKRGGDGGGVADKPQNQGRACAGKIDSLKEGK